MASALNCGCVPTVADDYDDYTKYTHSTADDGSELSEDSVNSEVLNTPYHRVTPLFRNIEKENWEGVLTFLTTGKWASSMFYSFNEHMRSPAPELQVKTWVTAYDKRGEPEWSQLPLHAAISYSAPSVVIQKIVELYPKAVRCTDNEGMLPIHLAYGFGASDPVLSLLADAFPSSMNEKGLGGRYPYECCELGPNKQRGKVYQIVSEQITNRVSGEIDKDWREFSIAAQESVGISKKEELTDKTLHEFLLDLLKDRKELLDLKQRAKQQKSPRKMSLQSTPSSSHKSRAKSPTKVISPTSSTGKKMSRWGRK